MNLFKAKIIFIALAALTCINVAGFFIFNQITEIASAGQVRTVNFPTITGVSRSGYSFDDIYRLTVPSSYHGCYVNVLPYASGDDCNTYCRVSITAKGCDNQSSCLISVSPSETVDMAFAPNDDCYGCYWGFYLYIYGWCGDGSCEYYTDDRSCVNNQLVPENCTNCQDDCATPVGYVCCNGVKYGGDCCADSDCGSGKICDSHHCETVSLCGNGKCDYGSGESCGNCSGDCGCSSSSCCAPDAVSYKTSYGCVPSGYETIADHICCSGYDYSGDCCADSGCLSGMACLSHKCASSSYCGDGACDSGETCSSCSSDCGACKKADGLSCSSASECQGNYCVHGKCRSSSIYCGDGACDSGETCSSCPSDCGAYQTAKPSNLSFGASGGTLDGGAVIASEGGYTWTVAIPDNFTKVETAHYDKNNPSVIKKYMGWNGYLKVNGVKVWEFKSWSSAGGGLIYDATLGKNVSESSGSGLWLDATKFFKAGSNTVTFYHYNEGDGIGLKIKVAGGGAKKADGSSCSSASECQGDYCVHGKCRSSSTYCGDGACDSGENCSSCSSDCACVSGKCCMGDISQANLVSGDRDSKGCVSNLGKGVYMESGVTWRYICCPGGLNSFGGPEYASNPDCCSNSDCAGGTCVDKYCVKSNSPNDAKKSDGQPCSSAGECQGNYCVHGKCRSSSTYCGDGQCDDSEACGCSDCSSQSRCKEQNQEEAGRQEAGKPAAQETRQAPAGSAEEEQQQQQLAAEAEKSPDLKLSFSSQTIALKVGEEKDLTVIFNNKGEGAAGNVYYSINVDRPEIAELSGLEKVIGDMAPAREAKENIKIKAKKSGAAYLMFHVRGDNFGSIAKFIRVDVEDALAFDAPESIYLLPDEFREFGVFMINQSSQPALVKLLTMTSSNPAVVSVEAGSVLEIKGGEQGIKPDQLFSTESEDILNSIAPRPKIKAVSEGDGELVFKLAYFIGGKEKIFEKKTKVKVGRNSSGQRTELKLEIVPPSLAVERGEAREVKLILKNTGSTIIKQGAIIINKPDSAPFEVTGEVAIKDYIEPGEEAVAKIEVIGHPRLSIAQEELAKKGELAIGDSITFSGQYATIDNRQFDFKNEMKISWVEERKKCDSQDSECVKAVDCLISLSNSMGCAMEFADIVPYLDKPVAAVLATSDACEIKGRLDSGDNIGAAISAILMASDVGDNAGEAVPGAGNLASAFVDTIEGAADCTEGFVHDAVDEYCAGGEGKGYSGCADKIMNAMAIETGRWKDPRAAKRYVVAVVGSPVIISVVDNNGKELTPADGVLTMQKEELKMAFIKNPDKLINGYNFKITGFDNGEYNLHLALVDNGLIVGKKEIINQPIEADKTVEIPMVVKTEENNQLSLLVGEEADKSKEKKKSNNYILLIIIAVAAMAGAGLIIYKRRIGGIKIKW